MQHFPIPYIQSHMAYRPCGCIGSCKKYQVSRPCFFSWYYRTLLIKSSCGCPGKGCNAGMCEDPTDISAAVERGSWRGASPYIGVADILHSLRNEGLIASFTHGRSRFQAARTSLAIDRYRIDPLGIGTTLIGQRRSQKAA